MDLAAMEQLASAQAKVLDAAVASCPAPAPDAPAYTARSFIVDVLERELYEAATPARALVKRRGCARTYVCAQATRPTHFAHSGWPPSLHTACLPLLPLGLPSLSV